MKELTHKEIISFSENGENPNIFDVLIEDVRALQQYDSVECHLVLYPYNRKIFSENIKFYPYEEYVKDILSYKNSAYIPIKHHFNKLFGIILGLVILYVLYWLNPESLLSVESIVSLIGAYIVGKELWEDIDNFLKDLSKNWKISYQESYYNYELVKGTTLSNYSYFAKKQRYGKAPLLPKKMNFIEQSNSQTLRIYFDKNDFKSSHGTNQAQMTAIHIDSNLLERFKKHGFMFGVKLSLNKHFLGIINSTELFQSLHNYKLGCLGNNGEWQNGYVFYRKTHRLGKIKYFRKHGLINNSNLLKIKIDRESPVHHSFVDFIRNIL